MLTLPGQTMKKVKYNKYEKQDIQEPVFRKGNLPGEQVIMNAQAAIGDPFG